MARFLNTILEYLGEEWWAHFPTNARKGLPLKANHILS